MKVPMVYPSQVLAACRIHYQQPLVEDLSKCPIVMNETSMNETYCLEHATSAAPAATPVVSTAPLSCDESSVQVGQQRTELPLDAYHALEDYNKQVNQPSPPLVQCKSWNDQMNVCEDIFSSMSLADLAFADKDSRVSTYVQHARKRVNAKENKKSRYLRRKEKRQNKLLPNGAPDRSDHGDARNDFPHIDSIPTQACTSLLDTSMNDLISMIRDQIPESSDSEECDALISTLESVAILGYQLMKADGYVSMVIALLGYMKMHTSKSIIKTILAEVDRAVGAPTEMEPNGDSLQAASDYWELFKSNKAFKRISFLMAAAMSLSVCKTKKIEWSPFGFQVICLEAMQEQIKPTTLVDTLLSTFKWFYETGSLVIETKSLVPIMYSDQNVRKFHADVEYVLANSDTIINGNGSDVQEFSDLVETTLTAICAFKAAKTEGPSASWLQARYERVVQIKQLLHARRKSSQLKTSPYGLSITGSSGVGKSTLAKIFAKVAATAILKRYDPSKSITIDPEDPHQNTYTSDVEIVFIDDIGNGKAQFQKNSPTNMIIKFFNNVAAQAIKAELNAKGVCYIDFKVGILTSNFKDFNVRSYTEKPEACLRRFDHVTPKIRPEFRKAGGVSLDVTKIPECGGMLVDVWLLTIEECVVYETDQGVDTYKFVPYTFTNQFGELAVAKDIGLHDAMLCVAQNAKKHAKQQAALIERATDFESMEFCTQCCLPAKEMCKCLSTVEESEEEASASDGECSVEECEPTVELAKSMVPNSSILKDIAQDAITDSFYSIFSGLNSQYLFWERVVGFSPIRRYATKQLTSELENWSTHMGSALYNHLVPDSVKNSYLVRGLRLQFDLSATYYDLSRWSIRVRNYVGLYFLYCWYYGIDYSVYTTLLWAIVVLFTLYLYQQCRMKAIRKEFLRRNDVLYRANLEPNASKTSSFRPSKSVVPITGAAIAIGIALIGRWLSQRNEFETNSEKKKEISWMGLVMEQLKFSCNVPRACQTATTEQISATVKKSVAYATFTLPNGYKGTNSLVFMQKGIAMFPEHVFYDRGDPSREKFTRLSIHTELHDGPNGHMDFYADSANCVPFCDGSDLVLCNIERCPDAFDFYKWLPTTLPKGSSMAVLAGRRLKQFFSEPVNVTYMVTGHKHNSKMNGGEYNHATDYRGLCMTPVIVDGTSPCVVGFHIASDMVSHGAMVTVTQSSYSATLDALRALPGVLVASRGELLPDSSYGIPILSGPAHPKSKFVGLDHKSKCTVYGSVRLRRESRSTVSTSCISDYVSEATGVENQWGPPQMIPNWGAYNATLVHLMDPCLDFPPEAVQRAREDFLCPLLPLVEAYAKSNVLRPLVGKEIVLGVPGELRINPLDMSTSLGYPLSGPKEREFEEIREGEILVDRIPSERIQNEVSRLMACWEKGERAYPIVSACLKDEATPLCKSKVRVFFIAPVALSLSIRKYFLSILGFLSANKELSEQAVGTNCFGPGWDQLMSHVESFADDDLFVGWDYSKYDTRLSSQLTTASWLVLINIAEASGCYSSHDLLIMKAMVTDIVHPVIDYNGTLVSFTSVNTSGHNCTVDINGLANSVLNRLAYDDLIGLETPFRDNVAIMTYGDDLAGSVHPDYRDFNFRTVKEFFAAHGIKITLPDKSDIICDFLNRKDLDFLKRSSNYIPEIDTRLGKLVEDSIFKSLHANLESKKVSRREVSASALVGAMHEWFAHGRDIYELRQDQMREVCERAGMKLNAVEITFDDRAHHWLENYR